MTLTGSMRESFVVGGQLCILVETVVIQIYTCGDKTEPHTLDQRYLPDFGTVL